MQKMDPRFVVTSSLRTFADQQRLYERFRAGGQGVFTVLPPGRSQHERGWAFDTVRVGVDPLKDELLHQVGAWWRSVGGVWGGPKDPVHFEAPKVWTGRSQ